MRVFAGLAAAVVLAVACSSPAAAPSPTATPTPSPSPTPAANVFKATLSPTNEVPPITSTEATCAGDATVTFTSTTAKFDVIIRGCPSTTAINIGHIHEGAAGANGGVVINTGLTAGELTLSGGGATLSKTATADAALITRIMANPAGFYVNFHSTAHGAGVIRGQLTKG
jgi:hypothetical protein